MKRVFAIPSYNRPFELKLKTLATLKRHGIDKENIWVFVANQEEYNRYEEKLDPDTYKEIKIGEKGIRNQRKYISQFFEEGIHIVSMDDDIEELFYRINDTEQAILNDLSKFIQKTENFTSGVPHFLSHDFIKVGYVSFK